VAAEPRGWLPARVEQLEALLRRHDYRGWDPFDLPNAPLFRALPQSWWLPQLALSKAGSRAAPDWLRRALRVPPIEDPKIYACAYFGYRHWDNPDSSGRARQMIDRLVAMAVREPDGPHWGYDYTWATRARDVNPRGASAIVPGAFALFALLDDLAATGEETHRDLIGGALDYLVARHRRSSPTEGFLAYFPGASINTHNANLLGCAALSLGGRILGRDDLLQSAADAAATSMRAVDARGYLPYADHPSGDWTDCFHHLYVIACATVVQLVNPNVDRELFCDADRLLRVYLQQAFLRDDGLINYYPGRLHPIDPHNYAAAAIFALLLGKETDLAPEAAEPLLRRLDELMWDPGRGRYRFRRYSRRIDSRLFLRWTQVWMFAALSMVHRGAPRLAIT
jgi:hypothetical protein